MTSPFSACVIALVTGLLTGTLFSCGDPPPDPPAPLPDLQLYEVGLDAQNVLFVTFGNSGEAVIPEGKGNVIICIDGKSIGGYLLKFLADQNWRNPGQKMTLRTNFKLAGTRRVSVALDTKKEIQESDEYHNADAATVIAKPLSGPDFTISDIAITANDKFEITLKNAGTAPNAAELPVRFRVISGDQVLGDYTVKPGAIQPGAEWKFQPSLTLAIEPHTQVRVLQNLDNTFAELDNTNGAREEILPWGPNIAKYEESILQNTDIMSGLLWAGKDGHLLYDNWTPQMKDDLRNALLTLERGENPAPGAPPVLLSGNLFSRQDAWTIYVAYVAQSLWVERNLKVKWSLKDLSPENRRNILSSKTLFTYEPSSDRYYFNENYNGNVTAWNPKVAFEFLESMEMLASDRKNTLYRFSEFMRAEFVHIVSGETYENLYGYGGPPAFDKVLYPLPGRKHVIAGCWGAMGMYQAALRTANIPVDCKVVLFGNSTHAHPEFPSEGIGAVHGDDPYSVMLEPSGADVPISDVFISNADFLSKHADPVPFCDASGCNSKGDQSAYYHTQRLTKACYDRGGDYLLWIYASGGAEELDAALTGDKIGGELVIYKQPFFPESERAVMVQETEKRLTTAGGGDLEKGKTVVLSRWAKTGLHLQPLVKP